MSAKMNKFSKKLNQLTKQSSSSMPVDPVAVCDIFPHKRSKKIPKFVCPNFKCMTGNERVQVYLLFMHRGKEKIYYLGRRFTDKYVKHFKDVGKEAKKFNYFNPNEIKWGQVVEKFKRDTSDSHRQNIDTRIVFRLNDVFLVKAHFTFGLRTVGPNHAHVYQTFEAPLLFYLLEEKCQKKLRLVDRSLPHTEMHFFDRRVLEPRGVYRIPPGTVYLVFSTQKNCFSVNVVSKDFRMPFAYVDPVEKRVSKIQSPFDFNVKTPFVDQTFSDEEEDSGSDGPRQEISEPLNQCARLQVSESLNRYLEVQQQERVSESLNQYLEVQRQIAESLNQCPETHRQQPIPESLNQCPETHQPESLNQYPEQQTPESLNQHQQQPISESLNETRPLSETPVPEQQTENAILYYLPTLGQPENTIQYYQPSPQTPQQPENAIQYYQPEGFPTEKEMADILDEFFVTSPQQQQLVECPPPIFERNVTVAHPNFVESFQKMKWRQFGDPRAEMRVESTGEDFIPLDLSNRMDYDLIEEILSVPPQRMEDLDVLMQELASPVVMQTL